MKKFIRDWDYFKGWTLIVAVLVTIYVIVDKLTKLEPGDNNFTGYGTYVHKGGDEYTGNWKDGKRHGQGIYMFVEGGSQEGVWRNNELYSGRYYSTNGSVVEFKNGKKKLIRLDDATVEEYAKNKKRRQVLQSFIDASSIVQKQVDARNKQFEKMNERTRREEELKRKIEDCDIGTDMWGNPEIEC